MVGADATAAPSCPAPDLAAVREYRQAVDERGPAVWPGWRASPLLLRAGACEYLLGHPRPPRPFVRLAVSVGDWAVHGALTTTEGPRVAGVWVAVAPAAAGARALAEAGFRAHALARTRGRPPTFGASGGLPAPPPPDRDAEAAALRAALQASSLAESRREAREFLRLRAQGRAGVPGTAAYERQVEWSLGAARYAAHRLFRPNARFVPGGRLTDLGAGQAFLLDRLLPGWRPVVLPGREALEDLVAEAARVPAALAELRVARILVAGERRLVALAERSAQWARGLMAIRSLSPLDGMLFVFPGDSSGGFWMEGTLIPLDIAFFDSRGLLVESLTMPLCRSDPCPTYGPDRPYRFALETPAGALRGLPPGARLSVPAELR
jgi:uncharacterized membrane protein (UPF0127 family)